MRKINLYPSLLDNFQRYYDNLMGFEELLKRINRVKEELTEPVLKGIAFHNLTQPDAVKQLSEFVFKMDVIDEVILRRNQRHAFHEVRVSKEIISDIILYGDIDTLCIDKLIDIKTTGSYALNKYYNKWQWRSYCEITNINRFEYVITDFNNVYYENYTYTNIEKKNLYRFISRVISELLIFNDDNLITDTSIFSEDKFNELKQYQIN